MYNSRKKITVFYLVAVLCIGILPTRSSYSYDGDIDYLAPYVTLDPESGKLVTIDPRKDQAAAAELQKQHDATAQGTTTNTETSTTTGTSGTDTSVTALSTPAGSDQQTAGRSPATAVIAAIGGILIIGVIVAMTRRKPGSAPDKPGA